jgi:hypothetical protein
MALKKKKTKKHSSIKGKILEMTVAGLHEAPNTKVERNVRLPSLRNPKRKREIDVLVSGLFSGYPVRIAIECKNRKNILDVEYIDAFIGKLNDVGIPVQHGIYVSPVGFTKGAIDRAEEVGIKPLLFAGLTPDRLSEKFDEAIQSVIYLLAEITKLSIECNVAETENSVQLWFLYDQDKNIQGGLPDFIWKKWLEGGIPSTIGEHQIDIEVPDKLQLYVDGKFEPLISAKANIKVIGLQISISGKVTEHALIDPTNQQINRFKTTISFDDLQGEHPIISFSTESDLQNFLAERSQKAKLTVGRIRLPRIRFYSLYWPLSERAVTEFATLVTYCQAQGRKPTDEEISSIEGNDLKSIWEPIWSENPLLQNSKTQNDRN